MPLDLPGAYLYPQAVGVLGELGRFAKVHDCIMYGSTMISPVL